MYKVAGLVGILTVLSKVLGLARDLVIANYFGTSVMADAFNMAYLFTGNFFILFGGIGGPFYSSVVAVLPKLKEKDPEAIKEFLKSILLKSFLALVLVTLVLFLFKNQIVARFVNPERTEYYELTLFHMQVLLPLVLICGPIGIFYGVLNVYKKYFAPSLSPAVVNVVLIGAIFMMGDSMSGLALSLGTAVGGLVAMLVQLPGFLAIKNKLKCLSPSREGAIDAVKIGAEGSMANIESVTHETLITAEDMEGGVTTSSLDCAQEQETKSSNFVMHLKEAKAKYGDVLYPALLGTFVGQGIVYVDSFFCDCLGEGSWTSIVMANRLIQMPLGVLLTAFLVPLFPKLSELAHENNLDEMKAQVKKALRPLVLLCLPATLVGALFAEPIIKLLFERGAFDANSTYMVSTVFFWLCFSIIPYVYRDTVTRVFYSLGDSRTPLYVAIGAILLKIWLNHELVKHHAIAGIPMATVAITILNFIVLSIILKKKTGKYLCLAF